MRRAAPRALAVLVLALLTTGFEWEGRLARLRRDLEAPDAARRREVVRLLATYPEEDVRDSLLEALGDPDAGVRAEAALAVGRVQVREAVPRLLDWLDDADADVRASAARALGDIGDRRTVPPLVRALGDANDDVRRAAIAALSRIATPDVVVPLLGRLDDKTVLVRVDAAEALGHLGDPRAVVPLLGRAQDDTPEVRVAVYSALGDLADARALPALIRGISDEATPARLAAVAALGRLHAEAAGKALVGLLHDADARVARAAVASLGLSGGETATQGLIDALSSPHTRDPAIDVLIALARRRRTAGDTEATEKLATRIADALDAARSHNHATALGTVLLRIVEREPIESLAPTLLRAVSEGRGSATVMMNALAECGAESALVPLLERLASDDAETRTAALLAVERYFERHKPDGRAADPLLGLLGRVETNLRVRVVRLLGKVGAARALPSLRPLLEHDDASLRRAAVQAIGAIGDPDGSEALLGLLGDHDPRTRFEAARALSTAATADTVLTLLDRFEGHEPLDRHAILVALGGALARLDRAKKLGEELEARACASLVVAAGGPDLALAARAVDALYRWGTPAAAAGLIGLVEEAPLSLARAAVRALGALPHPEALATLRRLVHDDRLGVAAVGSLAERGTREDLPRLFEVARAGPWPARPAAAFALARLGRRGLLREEDAASLCTLAEARDAYVRANMAVAMATLAGVTCADGPDPAEWMDARHAAAVRSAAARWLASIARDDPDGGPRAQEALDRCAERDLAPEVVLSCTGPGLPALDSVADVYAYSADGRRVLSGELVALRLADGSVLVAYTDENGHLRLDPAPHGRLALDDPISTPLEP